MLVWGLGLVVSAVAGVVHTLAQRSRYYRGLPRFFVEVVATFGLSVFQPLVGIRDMADRALDGDVVHDGTDADQFPPCFGVEEQPALTACGVAPCCIPRLRMGRLD